MTTRKASHLTEILHAHAIEMHSQCTGKHKECTLIAGRKLQTEPDFVPPCKCVLRVPIQLVSTEGFTPGGCGKNVLEPPRKD